MVRAADLLPGMQLVIDRENGRHRKGDGSEFSLMRIIEVTIFNDSNIRVTQADGTTQTVHATAQFKVAYSG